MPRIINSQYRDIVHEAINHEWSDPPNVTVAFDGETLTVYGLDARSVSEIETACANHQANLVTRRANKEATNAITPKVIQALAIAIDAAFLTMTPAQKRAAIIAAYKSL